MEDSPVVSVRTGGAAKQLRSVKRPRPLKMSPSQLDEVLDQVQQVETLFRDKLYLDPEAAAKISRLSRLLKEHGSALECYNKEAMSRLDTAMRVACRDPELDLVTRLHVLELVELRQNGWSLDQNILAYYRQKHYQVEQEMNNLSSDSNPSSPILLSGSQEFVEPPTGKVHHSTPNMTGDYLNNNNITATNSSSSNKFKSFNNNNNSSSSSLTASSGDHSGLVTTLVTATNSETLLISGFSEELVNAAKEVLEGFFSLCAKNSETGNTTGPQGNQHQQQQQLSTIRPEITYERDVLLQMAKSPLCGQPPAAWETIAATYPSIVKREGPTSKHFLREMASLRKQEAAKMM